MTTRGKYCTYTHGVNVCCPGCRPPEPGPKFLTGFLVLMTPQGVVSVQDAPEALVKAGCEVTRSPKNTEIEDMTRAVSDQVRSAKMVEAIRQSLVPADGVQLKMNFLAHERGVI